MWNCTQAHYPEKQLPILCSDCLQHCNYFISASLSSTLLPAACTFPHRTSTYKPKLSVMWVWSWILLLWFPGFNPFMVIAIFFPWSSLKIYLFKMLHLQCCTIPQMPHLRGVPVSLGLQAQNTSIYLHICLFCCVSYCKPLCSLLAAVAPYLLLYYRFSRQHFLNLPLCLAYFFFLPECILHLSAVICSGQL